MKKLIVTRHAKSSWDSDAPSDFHRPLNNRGIRDTPIMAERLHLRGTLPELILSSTAVRALETTDLLIQTLSSDNIQLLTTDSIYEAPLPALEKAIGMLPDHTSVAMIVGHNPGVSLLGSFLCRQPNLQMPTCAMACFELDIEHWQDVYRDCASMLWYDYPKNTPQL